MKNRFTLVLLALSALISCERNHELAVPADITVEAEKVGLKKAQVAGFTFTVSPADASFNYEIGNAGCQVSIEVTEPADAGSRPAPYYKMESIKPVKGSSGKYEVTLRDMNLNDRYDDTVVLKLEYTDPANGTAVIRSEPFKIRFSGNSMLSMTFLKKSNSEAIYDDITLDFASGKVSITSPLISDPNLIMTFESNGDKVTVDGVEQVSGETVNDFSSPVTYKVVSEEGTEKSYTVSVVHSGLPVLFINTPDGKTIPSKHEDWLEGTEITLYNTDWTVDYTGTQDNIRGRGNSTWNYPKKPYAIKLDSKAEILGMPKHKRWVLLANWMDRTIMRNRVSFAVAMKTGLAWTPHGEFVEVILNGKHIGNYYLCEHIKVDKNRVNVDELTDDVTDSGYIFELDSYFDEVNRFKSAYYDLPYMFKDPDDVNSAQFSFMQNYVNTLEASLKDNTRFAAREYTGYIDVDSFIDWWLVHELTGNEEPKHPKSSYMHKNTGGKLTMGPVWDFDWGTFMPHTKFVVLNRTDGLKCIYYDRLFQDPQFKQRVKERWNELEAGFREIPDFIVSEAARIRNSESMNWALWPITQEGGQGFVNGDETKTFDQAVERMKSSYEGKLDWMDKTISAW